MNIQEVSFHYLKEHRGNGRIFLESKALQVSGFIRGEKFTYEIDDAGETLIIKISFDASAKTKLHTVSGKKNTPVIDINNKDITRWMSDHEGFWVHYRHMEIVLTRVRFENIGACVKQNEVATLLSKYGNMFVGTNYCYNPQKKCPRDERKMASGEGYELCVDICNQSGHAEVNAIRSAGEEAVGSVILLQGHTYACSNCKQTAENAGVKEIKVLH